jgi:hypothetical protein
VTAELDAEPVAHVIPAGTSRPMSGKSTPQACRDTGISEQSYYRWRKEYGGLRLEQAKLHGWVERARIIEAARVDGCQMRLRRG